MQQSEGTAFASPAIIEAAVNKPTAAQTGRLTRFLRVNSIRRQLLFAFLAQMTNRRAK